MSPCFAKSRTSMCARRQLKEQVFSLTVPTRDRQCERSRSRHRRAHCRTEGLTARFAREELKPAPVVQEESSTQFKGALAPTHNLTSFGRKAELASAPAKVLEFVAHCERSFPFLILALLKHNWPDGCRQVIPPCQGQCAFCPICEMMARCCCCCC